MIRAKFTCESIQLFSGGETVSLRAATGPGNESWSKWTPAGSLAITINNPDACGKFKPGKNYYIDFSEAE